MAVYFSPKPIVSEIYNHRITTFTYTIYKVVRNLRRNLTSTYCTSLCRGTCCSRTGSMSGRRNYNLAFLLFKTMSSECCGVFFLTIILTVSCFATYKHAGNSLS